MEQPEGIKITSANSGKVLTTSSRHPDQNSPKQQLLTSSRRKREYKSNLMSSNVCNARYETEPGAVDSTDLAILYETHQNGRKRSKARLSISQWNGGRRDYIQR